MYEEESGAEMEEEDEEDGDDDFDFGSTTDLGLPDRPSVKMTFGDMEDEEEESDEEGIFQEEHTESRIDKWKRKDTSSKEPGSEKKPRERKEKGERQKKKKEIVEKTEEVELTQEMLVKKLGELLKQRGYKKTDVGRQIEQLSFLLEHAESPMLKAQILVHLAAAKFDVNPRGMSTHMPINLWKSCHANVMEILTILASDESLKLEEEEKQKETDPLSSRSASAAASDDGEEADQGPQNVLGNLLAFVERLDDEFIKSLQNIDPHTQDYVSRLMDDALLLDLAERVQKYYERVGNMKSAVKVAARRIDHIYYKLDRMDGPCTSPESQEAKPESATTDAEGRDATSPCSGDAPEKAEGAVEEVKSEYLPALKEEKKEGGNLETTEEADGKKDEENVSGESAVEDEKESLLEKKKAGESTKLLSELAGYVYKHGSEQLKTRAMLATLYHFAIHDKFYEARDLMLMSHLQDTISNADVSTQILFNRTMMQLGLCAFRKGLIVDAHSSLADIYSQGRVKELLAQGISQPRFGERDVKQEKAERRRQVPYHMHINLELLEAVHLVSAMLLEVPNIASSPYDPKKKVISRSFRRLVEYFERQIFAGPPENTREYVIAASKALSQGNWQKCCDLILGLKVWNLMPNLDSVKSMLRRKIQEEALRTFLFTYSNSYQSISLEKLATMFDLPTNSVHSLVSRMMIGEELRASWDQPTGTLVKHRVESSRLQFLAMLFAEKAVMFVENNERLLDMRTGGYGYKMDQKLPSKDRWQSDFSWSYQRQPSYVRRGQPGGYHRLSEYGRGYQPGGSRPRYDYHRPAYQQQRHVLP